ncbi:hypothetical protein [Longimicrobium sp.]|uniref:hypothetical protein n=1 Tax=Longimicrobium sp. TaxID=2029185 RepID=UPI002ED807B6
MTNVEAVPQKRVKRFTSRRVVEGGPAPAGHGKKVLGGASRVLKRAYARITRRSGRGPDHPGERPLAPVGEDMEAFFEAQKNASRASRALLSRQRQY